MWITVEVERVLSVDRGRNVILCELMPGHQTLVLKLKGSEMTDELQRLRSALESIADWRNVNISGEYEHGLQDIIRSIIDCAVDALDAPQVPRPAPQAVPMQAKPRPADCVDPMACLWRHVPTVPEVGLHLCSRFGCHHTTSAASQVARPQSKCDPSTKM